MRHRHYFSKKSRESKLTISILLNFAITAVEVAGGVLSGSLSLISDAVHNFSDAFSLITSYIAIKLSKRENTESRTFGYKRAEILAALFNALILIIVSFFLFKESMTRLFHPAVIDSNLMISVATIGLLANAISVFLLKKDSHSNINIRSAYLHLFSDMLSSIAVIAGGICILFFKVYWVDPFLTIFIGMYVLKEGYEIVRESVHILMQNTPKKIDIKEIQKDIEDIEGIKDIHHVHVWQVSERDIHCEAHINISEDIRISKCPVLREKIENLLRKKFNINHSTLQFEYDCCKGIPLIKR